MSIILDLAQASTSEYQTIVLTIVLILIIGRMIDRFVNGKDENN